MTTDKDKGIVGSATQWLQTRRPGARRVLCTLVISRTMQRSAGKPIVAKVTLPGAEQKPHVVLCFVFAHKRLWCTPLTLLSG